MAINFPDTPANGQIFTSGSTSWTYYTDPGVWKISSGPSGYTGSRGYTGSAGAAGNDASAAANGVIWETYTAINDTYTLSSGRNGMSVGPVTVANGASVTVPDGQRWVII